MNSLQSHDLGYLYNTQSNQILEAHHRFIADAVDECVDRFYEALLQDESSKAFVTLQLIEKHLRNQLKKWLLLTLSAKHSEEEIVHVVEKQREVGDAHARVEVPMFLVNKAMLVIKEFLFDGIRNANNIVADEKLELIVMFNKILDASLSLVNESYSNELLQNERMVSEYRTASNAQEIAIDLEKIKSAMLAWASRFITDVLLGNKPTGSEVAHQDFSLWIRHRLNFACQNNDLITKALEVLNQVESTAMQLKTASAEAQAKFAMQLNNQVSDCCWVLTQIADINVESSAQEDALTGLIERRFLGPIMQNETHVANQNQTNYSLMMLDIDDFKQVNDRYGHQVGDRVLSIVGKTLKRSLRVADYAFRYGGEEFLVLMPETSAVNATLVADKVLQQVRQLEIALDDNIALKITVSIGIAEYDQHPDYDHVLKHADDNLYQAKKTGKDKCVA